MPNLITPDLEALRGKSISDLCPQGFHDAEANHCAHFVSHVGGYQFGFLCHSISGSRLRGVSVRVQEIFPHCPRVGRWDNLPNTEDDLLVFITARRNVNLAAKTIINVPKKHIGIFRGGHIYHYSNTEDKVVRQTPPQVRSRFRSAYRDETVDLFFGTLPPSTRTVPRSRSAAAAGPTTELRLRLVRDTYTDLSTIGDLSLDGEFECHILEDKVRPEKIPGLTAIPAGTYEVDITWSPKFRRDLPLLVGVPNFTGIRIHPGNSPADTEGCLLPGRTKAVDFVGESRKAFQALFAKLAAAKASGRSIHLEIVETASRAVATTAPSQSASAGSKDGYFRVLADPLEVRRVPDEAEVAAITGRLDFGQIVRATRADVADGWASVETLDGETVAGLAPLAWLEAVPAPFPVALGRSRRAVTRGPEPAPPTADLYRVNTDGSNLRRHAGVIRADTVIASLPLGQLVTKRGPSTKPLWWEVSTVRHGQTLTGFIHSNLLSLVTTPSVPSETGGEVRVSEKAVQMILDFEGLDQPSKWPGASSGISLGVGYDLGYHTKEQFQSDWGRHLTEDQIRRLSLAIGKTGARARDMSHQFTDITIRREAAGEVFGRATLPLQKLKTGRTFPGVTALHPDAQGALVSLIFNRGESMAGPKRREMREIRDTLASSLPRETKLRHIAAAIRSMQRLWPDIPGLQRRRRAEAKMVEDTI